ncbi:hypothetical protein [Candidatus Protochlamydia phocaeensis]|uniref:hypothetical protein n=1 Tax=Candidatus Protochlamydia phocaeensis TaxID=1414722 RepID=UPI0008393E79|nr:hypothetical protein [Candidatus Protochlamydia phocaeensis]
MQISFSFPIPPGAAIYGLQLAYRRYSQHKAYQVSQQVLAGQGPYFNGTRCRFYSLRLDLSDTGFPATEEKEENKQKKAAEKAHCQQKSLFIQQQDAQDFFHQAIKHNWLAGIQYHGKEVIRLTQELVKESGKKEKEKS